MAGRGPIFYHQARCLVRVSRISVGRQSTWWEQDFFANQDSTPTPTPTRPPLLTPPQSQMATLVLVWVLCFVLNVELTSCFFHPAHTVHLLDKSGSSLDHTSEKSTCK